MLRTSWLGRSLYLRLRGSLRGLLNRVARLQGALGYVTLLRGALNCVYRLRGSRDRLSLHGRRSLCGIGLSLRGHTLPRRLRCGGLHGASDSSVWLRGSCLRGLTLHGYRSLGWVIGRVLHSTRLSRRLYCCRSADLSALTCSVVLIVHNINVFAQAKVSFHRDCAVLVNGR